MSNIAPTESKLEKIIVPIIEWLLTNLGFSYLIDKIETSKNRYFLWVSDKVVIIGLNSIAVFLRLMVFIYRTIKKLKF